MRIFSPAVLREFDNFLNNIRQKPSKIKSNPQHIQATVSKIRSKFMKWIITPIVVVAGCTYCLHLYNQHIENTWIDNTVNIYEIKQKVYWEAIWLLLKEIIKGNLNTSQPMLYYASRMNDIANRLVQGVETEPKTIQKDVVADIDFYFFKWNEVTHEKFINKRGDIVDEVKCVKLNLFGLNIWKSVESKVLKPYRKVELKRKSLFGLVETFPESLYLVEDVLTLKWPGSNVQSTALDKALQLTVSATQKIDLLLAESATFSQARLEN